MSDDTLRPGEAATQLGISTDTLRRWGDLGRIQFTLAHRWSTERRYSPSEVERVKATMTTNQPATEETTP